MSEVWDTGMMLEWMNVAHTLASGVRCCLKNVMSSTGRVVLNLRSTHHLQNLIIVYMLHPVDETLRSGQSRLQNSIDVLRSKGNLLPSHKGKEGRELVGGDEGIRIELPHHVNVGHGRISKSGPLPLLDLSSHTGKSGLAQLYHPLT